MSLKSCIRKAGRTVSVEDREAIYDLVDNGSSESDAVLAVLNEARQEVVSISNRIRVAGGKVDMVQAESEVDQKAKTAATSPDNDLPQPTQAQKEAGPEGNYKKGEPFTRYGVTWRIENPKGSYRFKFDEVAWKEATGDETVIDLLQSGEVPAAFKRARVIAVQQAKDGRAKSLLNAAWFNEMPAHYGHALGADKEGADGDKLDAFFGPQADDETLVVYVADLLTLDGDGFDEHKVLIGFETREDAVEALRASYDEKTINKILPGGALQIMTMSPDDFAKFVAGDLTKPMTPYAKNNAKPEKAVAEKKAKSSKPKQEIADFGEKIGGARKDLWGGFLDKINDELPEAAKIVLSKHFPEPNYTKLAEDGIAVEELALVKAMRDTIPNKPRRSWLLKQWGEKVGTIREFAKDIIEGRFTAEEIAHKLVVSGSRELSGIKETMDLYVAAGFPNIGVNLKGWRLRSASYTMLNGEKFDPAKTLWTIQKPRKGSAFGNWPNILGDYFESRQEALDAASGLFEAQVGEGGTKKPRKTKLDIYRVTATGEIWIGKKVAARKYIDLKSFPAGREGSKAARVYLLEHEDELLKLLEKKKHIPPVRRSTNDPRIGADYRQGEDVTPDQFQETFGFRGVEFGNWVEQKKRQSDLNNAYDGLLDLAGILDIPAQALALNGQLSLAFGARGKGGKSAAAAHYEPGKMVINLTKIGGAGSLAHEWWHSLDNYFGKKRGAGAPSYATESPSVRRVRNEEGVFVDETGVRKEVLAAYEALVSDIEKSSMSKRSTELDKRRTKRYWDTRVEMTARAFERYVIDKAGAKGNRSDYLANIVPEDAFADEYPYPTNAEAKVFEKSYDKIFSTLETQETETGVELYSRLGFVSALTSAAQRIPQEKGQPGQMLAMLKKQPGVKKEELEWVGVEEWLNAYEGSVTKQEIVEFVAGNGVRVNEVVLRGEPGTDTASQIVGDTLVREFETLGYRIDVDPVEGEAEYFDQKGGAIDFDDLPGQLRAAVNANVTHAGAAKFAEDTLPGGKNYREVLLTLPRGEDIDSTVAGSALAARDAGVFRGSHFDQPNVLAHIRLNDRTGPNGEKILFIEEVQSDHHQEGRKKGYKKAGAEAELDKANEAVDAAWADALEAFRVNEFFGFDTPGSAITAFREEGDSWSENWEANAPGDIAAINAYLAATKRRTALQEATPSDAVIDAPFKGNAWIELVLKRALRIAVEGGYDQIAWTTGEIQADRYDLSKQISVLRYKKNGENYSIDAIGTDGGTVMFQRQAVKPEEIESIVGKDVAEKILNGDGQPATDDLADEGMTELSGVDLKIGGEGMKSFYDRVVPNIMGKVVKKLDKVVKVGEITIEDNISAHAVKISPTMQRKAMGGLPLFQRGKTKANLKAKKIAKQLAPAIKAVSPILSVRVVQTVAEIPHNAVPSDIEGAFFNRGGVYLVADNLTQDRIEEVFRHEVFGHAAVERHSDFPKWLKQIQNARKVPGLVRDLAAEVTLRNNGDVLDQETEAKEIIALMAERGIKHSIIDRVIAAFRQLLRKIGLFKGVSEHEIRTMLSKSAKQFATDADMANNIPHLMVNTESSSEEILAAMNYLQPSDDVDSNALFSRPAVLGGRAIADDQVEAAMARVMVTPNEDLTVKDRVRRTWRKLTDYQEGRMAQGFLDSGHAIKMLEQDLFGEVLDATDSAYKSFLATHNLPSVMAAVLKVGAPKLVAGAFQPVEGRLGVIEMFRPIADHVEGNLMAQWEFFAAANRASRLITETNEDGTSKEKNFSQEDIDLGLALEEKYPEFRTVLDDWQVFKGQILDMSESAGVVNADERAIWDKNDHVPFYRAMSDDDVTGPVKRKGIADQRSGIRRLTGKDEKLGSVFENMMMNTAHLIDASFKNIAHQRTSEMALETGAYEKMPPQWKAQDVDLRQMEKRLKEADIEFDDLTPAERKQMAKIFVRVTPQGPDIVSALWKGKPTYYRVVDPMLLSSVSSMGHDSMSAIMDLMRAPKKWLTVGVTASPEFMLANLIRDSLSNWVVSNTNHIPFVDSVKGLSATFKGDENIMAIMMAGAGGGGFYDSSPEDIRKLLSKQMPRKSVKGHVATVLSPRNIWRFWQKVGASTENATRVAIFKRVMESGGSMAEAAYQARDVLNFTMHGDFKAMRVLTQSVPFLNARIQGLYRLQRGYKENPKAFALKGSILFALTMALLLRNNDRDEYEEIPEWDKDVYWHIFLNERGEPVGPADHWRIPKPFEIGSLFATAPERIQRLATGRDDWAMFQTQIGKVITETLAFNPMPQAIKPIVEQFANRSMFTGSPIVGLGLSHLEPEAQYNAWTSEFARVMAETMPDFAPAWMRSPRRLEHAVRAYFGTLGTYALSVADEAVKTGGGYPAPPTKKIYELPLFKRFLRDPNPRYTKYADLMYKMVEEANALQSTINRYREQGLMDKAKELQTENIDKLSVRKHLNKMVAAIRKLNNAQRLIMYSEKLTPAEKRTKLDVLTKKKNDLMRSVAPFESFF